MSPRVHLNLWLQGWKPQGNSGNLSLVSHLWRPLELFMDTEDQVSLLVTILKPPCCSSST